MPKKTPQAEENGIPLELVNSPFYDRMKKAKSTRAAIAPSGRGISVFRARSGRALLSSKKRTIREAFDAIKWSGANFSASAVTAMLPVNVRLAHMFGWMRKVPPKPEATVSTAAAISLREQREEKKKQKLKPLSLRDQLAEKLSEHTTSTEENGDYEHED